MEVMRRALVNEMRSLARMAKGCSGLNPVVLSGQGRWDEGIEALDSTYAPASSFRH